MAMQIMCSRGCGESINVTDEMIEEAKRHNMPLNVSHEVCPTDPTAPTRRFKITTSIIELKANDPLGICKVCDTDIKQVEGGGWVHEDLAQVHGAEPQVFDVEEPLASIGQEVEATSFKQALPRLQDALEKQWSRVVGMADIIDAEAYDGGSANEGG